MEIAYRDFSEVQPRVQEWMLRMLNPADPDRGADALKILSGAAAQEVDNDLRRSARSQLLEICYLPDAWDVVRGLADDVEDPQQRGRMEQRLLYNVARAHPEKATEYLREHMYGDNPPLRDAAVGQLIGGDDPKDAIVATPVASVTSGPA